MTNDQQEETYRAILKLYDLAEQLVYTVDSPLVEDQDEHLMRIEPMVRQLATAAEILVEEYAALVKRGEPLDDIRKSKMQVALGQIFDVLEQCKQYDN